ncbi:MAG: ATP-binding protein, partial [Treponema sp.]|nr:ATP-binding protein [Treponema sp.]
KSKKGETLLIKGARQIGKTFLVREFGKNEYKSFIEINFLKNPSLKSIFDGELTAEEVYKRISAHLPDAELLKGETLIFLDEIQKCAKARTSLKFLAEDDSFDIICSGSLLGLHYGQDDDKEVEEVESVPVGFERQLIMYSMDFKEFLWAYGYKDKDIEYLKSFYDEKKKIPSDILKKFQSLIKEYIVVGGMPEVVNDFVTHKDFSRVQNIQEKILSSYDDDIANHARGAEKVKVRKCYDSVPRQLARENKKFKYSDVEKGSTSRKYADSVMWLQDSNLVHVCRNLYEPYLPLKANSKDSEFKLYYNDTGLLLARYGFQTKLAVLNNTILGNAKGGIYENLISEMLIKLGYSLHYYKTENSTMEIEFVIEKDGGTIPVEVKAGNSDTPSLNTFLEKFRSKYGIKLIDGNLGVSENKLVLPHFMAMFL